MSEIKGTNDSGDELSIELVRSVKSDTHKRQIDTDVEEIVNMIATKGGVFTHVCEALNLTPAVLLGLRKKYKEIDEAFFLARQGTIDKAKVNLTEALNNREPWATLFVLKTLGKHEGFTERLEIDTNPPKAPQIRFQWDESTDDNSGHVPMGDTLLE